MTRSPITKDHWGRDPADLSSQLTSSRRTLKPPSTTVESLENQGTPVTLPLLMHWNKWKLDQSNTNPYWIHYLTVLRWTSVAGFNRPSPLHHDIWSGARYLHDVFTFLSCNRWATLLGGNVCEPRTKPSVSQHVKNSSSTSLTFCLSILRLRNSQPLKCSPPDSFSP